MDIIDKINVIKVQLETIQILIGKNQDCTEILEKFKTIKMGINDVIKEYVNSDIRNCLKNEKNIDRIEEIIKLITY